MKRLVVVSLWLCAAPLWAAPRAANLVPTIHSVTLEGNKAITKEFLLPRLTVKPGQLLKKEQVRFSLGVLESTYRDRGYYGVRVSTSAAFPNSNREVDLTFRIVEGDLFYVGQFRIEGNDLVKDGVILRGLGIRSGDLFSQSRFFEGTRELYMLGYFDTIDVSYSTTTTHQVDVVVKVKERPTRFLKGGLGYGTQSKERVSLGAEDLNFFGNGRKLDVTATYSGFVTDPSKYRTTLLRAKLSQPYIFDTRLDAETDITREWDDREAYDSVQTGWRTSVGRRIGSKITVNLHYRYQGTRVTRVSPLALTPGFTNISAVGPTLTYDNTDDTFLPGLGWRVVASYEEGLRFFNGDVRFHKVEDRLGRFDTLFGGWTFFEGLQSGIIIPDSGSLHDVLPIYERYFLGGANTVRGYSEKELGPRDATGAPLGGSAFLVGNLELRHHLYKKLFGVLFIDAGQLYPTDPTAIWPHMRFERVDDFRYGAGTGIRFHSPIGAIRFEFGYKLNPEGPTNFLNRAALHFSIGEVF